MSNRSLYVVEANGNDLDYEVCVNDWLIAANSGSGGSKFAWLTNRQIDSSNRVTITARLPEGVAAASPSTELVVRVHNAENSVYSFEWRGESPAPPLPITVQGVFTSATQFGLWSWQRAAPVTLDDATRQGVTTLLQQLHDALQQRDVDAAVRLFALRDRERAIGQGEATEAEEAAARTDYARLVSASDWQMQPLTAETLRFRLMADHRVIHVLAADGRDPLRTVPVDGMLTAFAVYASLLDNEWVVVH